MKRRGEELLQPVCANMTSAPLLCLLLGFTAAITLQSTDAQDFHPEDPCSSEGGICLKMENCPVGKLAQPGLCPEQQAQGAECCHGISIIEKRCRQLGGECVNELCKSSLQLPAATDCPLSTFCCLLI